MSNKAPQIHLILKHNYFSGLKSLISSHFILCLLYDMIWVWQGFLQILRFL